MSTGSEQTPIGEVILQELKAIKVLLAAIKTESENVAHYAQTYIPEIHTRLGDVIDILKAQKGD